MKLATVLLFNESDMCCGVLAFGKIQVEEIDNREHDGEEIVLPGEDGYSGDSRWENLGEDSQEAGTEADAGAGEGDDYHGGSIVTPRNKRARNRLEDHLDETMDENSSDEDDNRVEFGF